MSGAIGTRVMVKYRGEKMYVSIFPHKQEIFASMVERDPDKQNMTIAGIDAITRLSSKCWQAYGLDELLKQLKRASRVKGDFPGLLSTLLEDHG